MVVRLQQVRGGGGGNVITCQRVRLYNIKLFHTLMYYGTLHADAVPVL